MQELFQSFDKSLIPTLPRFTFEGNIIVVQGRFEAERAAKALMKQKIIGIDTETRPSFRKGHENKVALLQVSDEENCFLFRLNSLGFCRPLIDLLEAKDIIKIGLSLKDDIMRLGKMEKFSPGA